MFKDDSSDNDIITFMEKALLANQTERTHGLDKLARAVDLLNKAASILDEAEMIDESEDISKILESLTK